MDSMNTTQTMTTGKVNPDLEFLRVAWDSSDPEALTDELARIVQFAKHSDAARLDKDQLSQLKFTAAVNAGGTFNLRVTV